MKEHHVVFVDERIKKAFDKLRDAKNPEKDLYKFIKRAIDDLEKNPFCGKHIQKNLIPKGDVKKYGVENLWKYNLLNAWRLIYFVQANNVQVVSILLEWMDHTAYS